MEMASVIERLKVGGWAVGEFEHDVVGVQAVEEIDQRIPCAGLDGLAAEVAEAEVNGFFHGEGLMSE